MNGTDRREALLDLVQLRRPVAEAIEVVKQFPWDSDIELVKLTRPDALRVLKAFAAGTLPGVDCAAWANAIEGRDDIGLEEDAEEVLKDFLFEISTPEASRELTSGTAENWRQRLER